MDTALSAAHYLPWLFPKLLGAVYFLAFASLSVQVLGLYGAQGITPIASFLAELRPQLGRRRWWLLPSVFWLSSGDRVLQGSAFLGVALALLLVAGAPPVPLLVALWLLYLSFVSVGQDFLSFQWDALLLEAGFMTVFLPLADPAPPLVVFAYRFFLFRFMFSAGAVKLRSGDSTWRNLTALTYHYQTQPLPNRIGWYAHQLPLALQKLSVLGTFAVELGLPVLAFAPAPERWALFWLLIGFQGLIMLTGSYGFFNILTVVLAVPLLDDAQVRALGVSIPDAAPGSAAAATCVSIIFLPFVVLNLFQLVRLFYRSPAISRVLSALAPAQLSSPYGLFAVMTTSRFEFVLEGSRDHEHWEPYEFRWKPGDPRRAPRQAAPHQPRLDWQMWFAALDPRSVDPWLENLLVRLLQGAPAVLALLERNPFPDAPPAAIRLAVYRYRFTDFAVRRREGRWWERTLVGRSQPVALQDFSSQER